MTGDALALADGTTWQIVPGDVRARRTARVARQVLGFDDAGAPTHRVVLVSGRPRYQSPVLPLAGGFAGGCGPQELYSAVGEAGPGVPARVQTAAQVIAFHAEERGGLLLHAALAELDGRGVLLAGPSGVGKSTASRRLPPPWRSLSDDYCLVVPGADGRPWVHPWPTWSELANGVGGRSWPVGTKVPLAAIFFLRQAAADAVASLGSGEAVCRLVIASEQALALPREGREERRVRRFDSICSVVRAVPAYRLDVSLDGQFWLALETALARR